jgi:hypothetical protein
MGRQNTRNEREAGFLPWDKGHPSDGEVGLVVRTPGGEEEFGTDDPAEFVGWLENNHPVVLNSILLELATYRYDGSRPTLN